MSGKKTEIFGVKFDNMTTSEIAAHLLSEIRGECSKRPLIVFTPNPEIVMEAQKNSALFEALKKADITSADGVGIVWASKYFGEKIKERASGYDIVQELFAFGEKSGGLNVFFLGGSGDAVTKAAEKTEEKYPALNVKGVINGYFEPHENVKIIEDINSVSPDLLLVGLGSPKQEEWVAGHYTSLSAKVIITVGGSFDVMSGKLRRAPEIFRKLGLEWLYRLLRQPRRFKRMLRLPIFVIKVLIYNAKNRENSI